MSSADTSVIDVQTPLLASLPEAALERIRLAAQMRSVPNGETIIAEGETSADLFIIGEGEVGVVARDAHGQPQTLARLQEGECFGELSLVGDEPASASVIALADTTLWALSHADFAAIAEDHPELSRNLSAMLGERLRMANKRYLRTRRGRLICVAGPSSGGAPWAYWLTYHLARSIAAHSKKQVAFLDLSRRGSESPHAGLPTRSLDGIAGAGRREEGLDPTPEGDGFVHIVAPSTEEGALSEARLALALERLQEDAQYVLAFVCCGEPAEGLVLGRADTALAVLHEADTNAGASLLGQPRRPSDGQLGLALVSEQKRAPTVGEMLRAQSSWGSSARVRSIIPGGVSALGENVAEGSPTRRAIDRLARSLIGLTVGLALGGGGSRGYAHIGVLRALQRAGIPFDCVAGCSIGACLAVGVAADFSLDEIREHLDAVSQKAVRLSVPIVSVLTSRSMRAELRERLGELRLDNLPTPAGIVAVDIWTGEEVVLRRGPAWQTLMASMALPGIYEPVHIGSRYLVDGGLLNPVPVSAAVGLGANIVISSNLSASAPQDGTEPEKGNPPGRPFIVKTITRSMEIMQSRIVQESCSRADVEIRPDYAELPGLLDFKHGRELEEAGERAAEGALSKLGTLLPWLPAG